MALARKIFSILLPPQKNHIKKMTQKVKKTKTKHEKNKQTSSETQISQQKITKTQNQQLRKVPTMPPKPRKYSTRNKQISFFFPTLSQHFCITVATLSQHFRNMSETFATRRDFATLSQRFRSTVATLSPHFVNTFSKLSPQFSPGNDCPFELFFPRH